MPRLPHQLLLRAHQISPFLPLLLRITRDLPSAINELRWLREHVKTLRSHRDTSQTLLALCKRREKGEPLQYILGTQPFGDLEIICKHGVLIPRPETEAYTTHLAKLVIEEWLHTKPAKEQRQLKILDVCSGTGCIALLLYSHLSPNFPNTSITGWDISPKALNLSNMNLSSNTRDGALPSSANQNVHFQKVDLFNLSEDNIRKFNDVDIIVSNPPYISKRHFVSQTTRSVRNYEPILALVPSVPPDLLSTERSGMKMTHPEDVFYTRLLSLLAASRARVLLLEVGDREQGTRVVKEATSKVGKESKVEVWRDWPDQEAEGEGHEDLGVTGKGVEIRGAGKIRSVVTWRKDGSMDPGV